MAGDTTGSGMRQSVQQVSADFARAAEHLSRACGQRLTAIANGIAEGDFSGVTDRITALAESREVVAISGQLAGLGLKLQKLKDDLAASSPLAKIVIGLTSVAAGGLGGALIASIFGATAAPAIAFLLIAGGLIYALAGLADLIGAASDKIFD